MQNLIYTSRESSKKIKRIQRKQTKLTALSTPQKITLSTPQNNPNKNSLNGG